MPNVMGRELELPPVLSVGAVLIGGEAGGVLGMFLSIPAIITVRILWRSTEGLH
jgi:predicted PurR-regulated permease PerM